MGNCRMDPGQHTQLRMLKSLGKPLIMHMNLSNNAGKNARW